MPPQRSNAGYWFVVGCLAWLTVAVVAFVDIGYQHVSAGRNVGAHVIWAAVLWTLPGAFLTPLMLLLFSKLVRPSPVAKRIAIHVMMGIVFWISWAALYAGVVRTGWTPVSPPADGFAAAIRLHIAALMYNAILLYSALAVVYEMGSTANERRRQEARVQRLERELGRAKNAALSAQLDPHFVFNTLHAASGLLLSKPNAARSLLTDLHGLLSASLRRGDRQMVSLESEIQLIERYLRIQQLRFQDRLDVEVILTDIDPLTPVPPLVLQPLVENAIQHGIAKSTDGGSIRISATAAVGRITLEVLNNGRSPKPRRSPAVRERVGLGGIRARLDLLFGPGARMSATHMENGAFRTSVSFPDTRWVRSGQTSSDRTLHKFAASESRDGLMDARGSGP